MSNDALALVAQAASREFEKISPESLRKELRDLTADTAESRGEAASA